MGAAGTKRVPRNAGQKQDMLTVGMPITYRRYASVKTEERSWTGHRTDTGRNLLQISNWELSRGSGGLVSPFFVCCQLGCENHMRHKIEKRDWVWVVNCLTR